MTREELIRLVRQRDGETIHRALDIRIDSFDPDAVVVSTDVDRRLYQHGGVVHGAVFVLLAESAASLAAALSVDMSQYEVFGTEVNASHLRAVTSGSLKAVATPVYRGRSHHVYSIEVTDQETRVVSACRCTITVRNRSAE